MRHNGTASLDYYPYGQERTSTSQKQDKFATYLRDSNGLDYADQRYYASTAGRFMTADPYQASAGAGDPQSWNRYSYVQGDPINMYDPEGLYGVSVNWGQFENRSNPSSWNFQFSFSVSSVSAISINLDRIPTPQPRAPRSGVGKGDMIRDSVRNTIYQLDRDTNFTAQILDCMSGIETGGKWNLDARTGTHEGIYQMNPDYWTNVAKAPIAFRQYVHDAAGSTMVVVAGLYEKARSYQVRKGDSSLAQLNASGILSIQQVHGALAAYRGSPNDNMNSSYGTAIINCSRAMTVGDFQRGMDWIKWYGWYESTGQYKIWRPFLPW